MTIHIQTELLACKRISDQARKDLQRAGCTIHKEVAGLQEDIEVVELQYLDMKHSDGQDDRTGMFVWGVPREIQIRSRELYLHYQWSDGLNGYELCVLDEDEQDQAPTRDYPPDDGDELGNLDEAPF